MSGITIAIIALGLILTILFLLWFLKGRIGALGGPSPMADRVEPPPGYYDIHVTYKGKPSKAKWESHIPIHYKDSYSRTHSYKIIVEYKYKGKDSFVEEMYTSKNTLKDELLIDI
jgi:hypothetical protein